MRHPALALTLAVLGGLAPPAAAATLVPVGTGQTARLAMDDAGGAQIAYYVTSSGGTATKTCRVPRGAAACSATASLAGLDQQLGGLQVFATGPVRVYGWTLPGKGLLFTSPDGGNTYGAAKTISDVSSNLPNGTGGIVLGPGASITSISGGGNLQNGPLEGSPATTFAQLSPSPTSGTADVALDGTTPVALLVESDGTFLRRYDGSGSLNDVANWTAAVKDTVASGRETVDLVGGPGGTFLLERETGSQTPATTVRRLTASGSGPSFSLGTGLRGAAIHEDPASGALHVVYAPAAGDTDSGVNELRWRTSTDGGATFSAPVAVYRGAALLPAERGGVSITADGHGWAIFGTASGPNQALRALELSPVVDAPPSTTTTTTATPPPPPPPDTVAPVLSKLAASPSTFRLGAGATPFSFRKAPQGTQLRFTLSEPATVRLRLLELGPGLTTKDGGCLPQTPKALKALRKELGKTKAIKKLKGKQRKAALAKAIAKRACDAVKAGGLDRSLERDGTAGANAIPFTGRIQASDGKVTALAKGTGYRIVATAQDAAGNRSKPLLAGFTVAKG